MSTYQLQQAQGWYSSDSVTFASLFVWSKNQANPKSRDGVLANVFAEAKLIFEDALCENEKDKAWIISQASIDDVIRVVGDAQDAYRAKHTSKAWKWLAQFSNRMTYYGSILDVMVQHHPEYVSLAGGAMNFLFIVSTSPLEGSFSTYTDRVFSTMRS